MTINMSSSLAIEMLHHSRNAAYKITYLLIHMLQFSDKLWNIFTKSVFNVEQIKMLLCIAVSLVLKYYWNSKEVLAEMSIIIFVISMFWNRWLELKA